MPDAAFHDSILLTPEAGGSPREVERIAGRSFLYSFNAQEAILARVGPDGLLQRAPEEAVNQLPMVRVSPGKTH